MEVYVFFLKLFTLIALLLTISCKSESTPEKKVECENLDKCSDDNVLNADLNHINEHKVEAFVDSNSKSTQKIELKNVFNSSTNASILIQPGTLSVNTSIIVEKSTSLENSNIVKEVSSKIGEQLKVVNKSEGIIIRPSESSVTLSQPLTIQISLPSSAQLYKLTKLNSNTMYVVMYRHIVKSTSGKTPEDSVNDSFVSGVIPESNISIKDGYVSFKGFFGVYWLTVIEKPSIKLDPIEIKTTEPILNSNSIAVVSEFGEITSEKSVRNIEGSFKEVPVFEYSNFELTKDGFVFYNKIGNMKDLGECSIYFFDDYGNSLKLPVKKEDLSISNNDTYFSFNVQYTVLSGFAKHEENKYKTSCSSSNGIYSVSEPFSIKISVTPSTDKYSSLGCREYNGRLGVVSLSNLSNISKGDDKNLYFNNTENSVGVDFSSSSCSYKFSIDSYQRYLNKFSSLILNRDKENILGKYLFFRFHINDKRLLCGYGDKNDFVSSEFVYESIYGDNSIFKSLKCSEEDVLIKELCSKVEGFCSDKKPDITTMQKLKQVSLSVYPYEISSMNNLDIEIKLDNVIFKNENPSNPTVVLKTAKSKCEITNIFDYTITMLLGDEDNEMRHYGKCEYKRVLSKESLSKSLYYDYVNDIYRLSYINTSLNIGREKIYCQIKAFSEKFDEYFGPSFFSLFSSSNTYSECYEVGKEVSLSLEPIYFDEYTGSEEFEIRSEPYFESSTYIYSSNLSPGDSDNSLNAINELNSYDVKLNAGYCTVTGSGLVKSKKVKLGTGHLICDDDEYFGMGTYGCKESGSVIYLSGCEKNTDTRGCSIAPTGECLYY